MVELAKIAAEIGLDISDSPQSTETAARNLCRCHFSLTRSGPPMQISKPGPPFSRSTPGPPIRISFPIPPKIVSFPASPKSTSFPLPPETTSFPAPPKRRSSPVTPPETVSLYRLPKMTSLPPPPVTNIPGGPPEQKMRSGPDDPFGAHLAGPADAAGSGPIATCSTPPHARARATVATRRTRGRSVRCATPTSWSPLGSLAAADCCRRSKMSPFVSSP